MSIVTTVFALVAGLMHVVIFSLESLLFRRPTVYRRFLFETQADAEVVRPMAFNQGFYNLFLAIGAIGGVVVCLAGEETVGQTLAYFACASMVAAGLVLIATDRRMLRAALTQAVPPAIALLGILL